MRHLMPTVEFYPIDRCRRLEVYGDVVQDEERLPASGRTPGNRTLADEIAANGQPRPPALRAE